jgi:CubicO group peptidase (beta-lactamase class C family)
MQKTNFLIHCLLIFFTLTNVACQKEPPIPGDPSNPPITYTLDDVFSRANYNGNLKCLVVYKDDRIVKEKYFNLGDSLSPHDVRSVTKSVMATLIGIAIDKGFIQSENQPIGDYLRPLVGTIDNEKANIRICDVL